LHPSVDLQHFTGKRWLDQVRHCEALCNAITALIAPEQYDAGEKAIDLIKQGVEVTNASPHAQHWNSVFNGSQAIANRNTPAHRDTGGCFTHYDLLVSAGTHKKAAFTLPELGMSLPYQPGDVVALFGRVLLHEVNGWSEGERICITHYMKARIHERLGIPRPKWPLLGDYESLIGK
jgi:hypothetical protein